MVNIRTANINDLDVLLPLCRKTFTQAFGQQNTEADMKAYIAENFTNARLKAEMKEPGATFVLAFMDNNEAAGYARIRRSDPPEALQGRQTIELERLYVLKKFQGQQIGKALLEICLALAQQTTAGVIWLGVWEHNLNAQEFYRKFGFEVFGQHDFRLGSDIQTDLLMKLELLKD